MNWFGADIYVDFAWGDPPLTADASCTWVDETAYVRSISTRRGTTSELSPVAPGTKSVALDNSTRRFDPSHSTGDHYGELLPMTKVRFRAGAGAAVVVFSGFVLGWPIAYPGIVDSVVSVQCVDATRVLEQSDCPGSAYGAAVLADDPINYWPMQEDANSPTWVDVVDPTGDLVPESVTLYPATTSTLSLPLSQTTAQIGRYRNPFTTSLVTPAALEMWVSTSPDAVYLGEVIRAAASDDFLSVKPAIRANSSGGYVELRYSHGGKTDSTGSGVTLSFPTPRAVGAFHLVVTADSTTLKVYVNGEQVATDTLAAGSWTYGSVTRALVRTGDTAALSHVAAYSTAPTAARILTHYEAGTIAHGHPMGERTGTRIDRILTAIGWPSADRDIATGSTVTDKWEPAGRSALAQIRDLEALEQGLFFISADGKPTFRDRKWFRGATNAVTPRYTYGDGGGSEIPYEDIEIDGNHLEHIRNTVTVSYSGASVTVKDATSRTNYGIQADNVTANDLPASDGWLARQLGNFRLRARKDPTTRIPTLRIQPRGAGALATTVPSVAALELGDRVRVIRRPNGSTDPIQQDCNVLGINHNLTAKGVWTTDLYLAPARKSATEAGYMITGTSLVGDTTTSY